VGCINRCLIWRSNPALGWIVWGKPWKHPATRCSDRNSIPVHHHVGQEPNHLSWQSLYFRSKYSKVLWSPSHILGWGTQTVLQETATAKWARIITVCVLLNLNNESGTLKGKIISFVVFITTNQCTIIYHKISLYIIDTPTCFGISRSSSGNITFVP